MTAPYCDKWVPGYSGHMSGPNGTVTRIVIHGTVSPLQKNAAVNTAGYFQNPNSGGLAHYVVDADEVVGCCDVDTSCWHAPPNAGSVGIEECDPQAGDGKRWTDAPHEAMLKRTAKLVHLLARDFGLPIVHLSPSDLLAGRKGIAGHVDVSQAWHQSDHSDPGPDFPWAHFLDLVKDAGQVPAPTPPVVHHCDPGFAWVENAGCKSLATLDKNTKNVSQDGHALAFWDDDHHGWTKTSNIPATAKNVLNYHHDNNGWKANS